MLSDVADPPYDRPPLSKAVLAGVREHSELAFDAAALDVDVRLGVRAISLDPERRIVATTAGDIGFDRLVIATGARPIRLPGAGEQLALRTIDDARVLRGRLREGSHLVIIGASWIGAEVATTALARGCRVTCIEAGIAPLEHVLGAEVGQRLVPWWDGVELRTGTAVAAIQDEGVVLADGEVVAADVVLSAVGVRPDTDWLMDSGLDLDRGVLVDEFLRSSIPGVISLGDVAARWSPRHDAVLRLQHWEDAASAGVAAAAAVLATDHDGFVCHDPVPYFWSDQFGHKIQYVGHHTSVDTAIWRDLDEQPGATVSWLTPAGTVSAVMTIDRPRECVAAQDLIRSGFAATAADLRDSAQSFMHLLTSGAR
jgi:NADPH-dependent 2,4-dienoyl-CoA reductase/sulfur reductase-like enzyme